MTDKQSETNGQKMSRLIREAPARKDQRQAMLDHLRRDWTTPATTTDEENDRA